MRPARALIDLQALRHNYQLAREVSGAAMRLMIDTNCPWRPDEAVRMAKQFRYYDPFWLEEPIFPPENFEALADLGIEATMDEVDAVLRETFDAVFG